MLPWSSGAELYCSKEKINSTPQQGEFRINMLHIGGGEKYCFPSIFCVHKFGDSSDPGLMNKQNPTLLFHNHDDIQISCTISDPDYA
jgi:hypothetical protein